MEMPDCCSLCNTASMKPIYPKDSPLQDWLKCGDCEAYCISGQWLPTTGKFQTASVDVPILIRPDSWGADVTEDQAQEFNSRLCKLIVQRSAQASYNHLISGCCTDGRPWVRLAGNRTSVRMAIDDIGGFINKHWADPEIRQQGAYDPTQHYRAILQRQNMQDGGPGFLDCGDMSEFYRAADDAGKKKLRELEYTMRRQILEENLDKIIERDILSPHVGVMKIGTHTEFWTETKELFVQGFFYACIAFAGFTVERICQDLIRSHQITYKSKILTVAEKEKAIMDFALNKFIEAVHDNGIVDDEVYDWMHKIKNIRNDYVHTRNNLTPEQDSSNVLKLLCDIIEKVHTLPL